VTLPAPHQLRDDLRGTFRGALFVDPARRSLYASDASPFHVTPIGAAVPADEADLRVLVQYAHETGLPLIARGAGTGLAGESLGPGLVVDLSVNFRKVLARGPDWITAEPGVVLASLNAELAKVGQRFAPDPASSAVCTLGGMVATNASGANAMAFGYTRDYALGLRTVWDNGEVDEVGRVGAIDSPSPRTIELRSQTAALLTANRDLLQTIRPQTRYNRCGYVLHDAVTSTGLDLTRVLVGSEGTLGLTTAVTLRTVPAAGGTAQAVLGFASVEAAVKAGLGLRSADGIVGCDLLDQRMVALSRSGGPGDGPGLVPPAVGAALVLTFEGETERAAAMAGRAAVARIRGAHVYLPLAEPTTEPEGLARIRRFRDAAVGGLYALGPGARPVACVEDVAVPAEELSKFLAEVRVILRRFDLTASVLVHVLAGQVHTRPLVDLANPADRDKLWPLAEAVHGLALSLGGTVSTQHGTGLARTPWVEKQYGPIVPVFQELKRIFDPKGILNPGKIVGPDPSRPAWPLAVASGQWPVAGEAGEKSGKSSKSPTERTPLLVWPTVGPARTAAACNGCGDCRTAASPTRMCPIFRATRDEAATPRAKANLFLDPFGELTSDEARTVAGLCVNCKMCRDECRARVDIPKLMIEAKAARQAEHGLDRGDWALARVESLAALAGNFAFTANALLGGRATRWALEKLFGLSRRRTLPKFTHRTFLRRARKLGLTARLPAKVGTKRLAYFVDGYANYNDPLIGEAAVAVLRHHGFEVHVPRRQRSCGMAPLAQGDLDAARDSARANVRILADLVRDGYRIVCTEPTAALALTQDYLDLLDDPDARLVAANTVELTALLAELHRAGRFRTDFQHLDLALGHHVPCHMKALRGPVAAPALLELIPGVRVYTIDVSCSGMAGTFGLTAANYATSLAAGRPMLDELDRPRVLFGSTECGSCRMQMQDGSGKRTLHPVQYLAYAYGLLPEIEAKLRKPLTPLVTD